MIQLAGFSPYRGFIVGIERRTTGWLQAKLSCKIEEMQPEGEVMN